jgi:hypothetical protein
MQDVKHAGLVLEPRHHNRLSFTRARLTITISFELGAAGHGARRAVSVDG